MAVSSNSGMRRAAGACLESQRTSFERILAATPESPRLLIGPVPYKTIAKRERSFRGR